MLPQSKSLAFIASGEKY